MATSTSSTGLLRQVWLTGELLPLLLVLLAPLSGTATSVSGSWPVPGFGASMPQPYRCRVDSAVNGVRHEFRSSDSSAYVVGVKGPSPAIIYLIGDNPEAGSYQVQLTLDDRSMTIQRVTPDSFSPSITQTSPPGLLSESSFRYFWVRAVSVLDEAGATTGEISLGRASENTPLLSYRDADFVMPTQIRFRASAIWLHSCSPSPPKPSLGCRQHTVTDRYGFQHDFPIAGETVTVGGSKAVRFMVKGPRDSHVRLKGTPSEVFYEIDINFVNKIAIQKVSQYLDITSCHNCLSPLEFRLFTVLYNDTTISLFEGAELEHPKVSAQLQPGFNITSISFASMGSGGQVHWLHACQGEAAALPGNAVDVVVPRGRTTAPPPPPREAQRPMTINTTTLLPGCRMVHTFKYHFDGFFALSEEGWVSGPESVLVFRVLGRKDIHLQLASSIPPNVDDTYEIDIDFYNNTNLDRGKEVKVASTQHPPVLSPTELRTFVLQHNLITGLLNLTAVSTGAPRTLLLWRDPRPFALRYFSVSSGSSAGNDTTWIFGCDGQHRDHVGRDAARARTGCSAPLLTFAYSHSQYLSVEREGEVDGPRRTLRLYLRALASGHIRLEAALPPGVDALFEIDLSHEGNTSIDSLGKRVATVRMPGLLSQREARGFWVRQDTAARTLAVGKEGSDTPLLSWTAPASSRFPPLRFFSLATSRSVGNGTWVYGCKNGSSPGEVPVLDSVAVEESVPSFEDELMPSVLSATQRLDFYLQELQLQPPDGTAIGVRLHLSRVIINDLDGTVELRGNLLTTWHDTRGVWEPKDFEDIQDASNRQLESSWTPTYTIPNGDVMVNGLMHVRHTGDVRWEGALHVQSQCMLQARDWPRDRHTCIIEIGIESAHRLHLLDGRGHPGAWVEPGASHPLWVLEEKGFSLVVRNESGGRGPATSTYLSITVTLSRASPVLHHLLLAPFVVLVSLCLLAYWVREPLPRDKVLLGAGGLLLLVFSFIVLEAACPPALFGMPHIVEVYCWCMLTVALSVTVSCGMTALSKDVPVRRPPPLLCRLLSAPLVQTLLLLHSDQVQQRCAEYELSPDSVDYVKGSPQVYFRFDQERADDCKCNDKECSKQVAAEAQYYWALLALACERVLSVICFILLLCALIVVKL
ncbi:uncharacterized protein LOC113204130 [Frankliniella occidentalis]|uniref:Uncharacterized protein LOC113204130 n=1 Tax=Frankliniella occidentalis TaxID=133901 RepID=A0A6J1S1N9_FRAOC|nr:uncharacterized protein LOC113204130 [Frankliniella occidentalis]